MVRLESQRAIELATASCESVTETDAGVLDSTQRLTWTDRALPEETLAVLPERMEVEHFRAVERSVLGLVRCSVRANGVDCSMLGLIPLLSFGCPKTVTEADRITREWNIKGGMQARREPELGTLTLEWACVTCADGLLQHTLSARVDRFPSRFLPGADSDRPGGARRLIAACYARYHAIVTCRYLRRLALWMHAETARTPRI